MRAAIPLSYKARIRWCFLLLRDLLLPIRFSRSRNVACTVDVLELSQPFMPSETLEAKKRNLREAARRINGIVVMPGEVFSFWRVVGNPNNPRRFSPGRSLHCGKPVKDFGGGLCQASGIIHHAALVIGLEIVERYNHSVDLYTEATRFAPLGSDATVFYGYKDLRVRNITGHPLRFELLIEDSRLVCRMYSDAKLDAHQLHFAVNERADGTKSVEVRTQTGEMVSTSEYKPLCE